MNRLFTRALPANRWGRQFKEPLSLRKQEVHNCWCHRISCAAGPSHCNSAVLPPSKQTPEPTQSVRWSMCCAITLYKEVKWCSINTLPSSFLAVESVDLLCMWLWFTPLFDYFCCSTHNTWHFISSSWPLMMQISEKYYHTNSLISGVLKPNFPPFRTRWDIWVCSRNYLVVLAKFLIVTLHDRWMEP